MQKKLFKSVNQLDKLFSIEECKEGLEKLEWKKGGFEKQSWGHSLHRIGPYVGRIKPSFAHFIIKYFTNKNETILDPFCGIGTLALEAALNGRNAIGFDINPYALKIAKSKTQINLDVERLTKIVHRAPINKKLINLDAFPDWVKEYYNLETLKEILSLLEYFKRNHHPKKLLLQALIEIIRFVH